MDDFEKIALRRRKPQFAESVEVNNELLADLQARGLLGDDAMEQLKGEKNGNQRSFKLVDWLMESKGDRPFQEVCNALVTKYPALAKEIQTEVRIERGDVVIDEDVMKEAGTLVHRKFGTSRRFAETDKKDMTDLIAIKIQLSKEEWKQEMDQVREELNRYIELCKQKDQSAMDLDTSIANFVRRHEEDLTSQAHGMATTTDIIISSVDDTDFFGKLKERLTFLMQRTERVIEERELMTREREKATKSLEQVNKRMISSSSNAVDGEKLKKEMDAKEALLKRLRKNNESLENESEKNEKLIDEMTEAGTKQAEKIAELEEKVKQLESGKPAARKQNSPTPPTEKPRTGSGSLKSSSSLSVKGTGSKQPLSASSSRKGSARK